MFRSIRWRLVASYTLMTILAVTLVGILALFLIERYLLHQERDYLAMNATAVAQQLEPMLQARVAQPALIDLARTTAFLGDMQVRILDAEAQLLADSGQPAQSDTVALWLSQPVTTVTAGTTVSFVRQPEAVFQVVPAQAAVQPQPAMPPVAAVERPMPTELPPMIVFRRNSELWNAPSAIVETQLVTTMLPQRIAVGAAAGVVSSAPAEFGFGSFVDGLLPESQSVVKTIGNTDTVFGYVEVRSESDFAAALQLIRRAFLLAGGGVSLLAMVIALWMSRSLTAPLQDLMETTAQMHGGVLSARAVVHTHDEIGLLASQFNTMATQLESSFAELAAERDALRRFVADASHELRTPITALKTFIELLQGPAGDQTTTRTEFLQESQQQLQRLEWTTAALLQLSRLDAGLTDLKTEPLDLRELLAPMVKAFALRAQEKAITLTLSASPAPCLTVGNAAYLEMALGNLVDNALKFTPAGGAVELGVAQASPVSDEASARNIAAQAPLALLWVRDNGVGIAPADQPYVFDRFYRGHLPVHTPVDRMQERTGSPAAPMADDGCGLGLAIVQSIVKAHGGQVTVESAVGVGSRFVIKLPGPGGAPVA